MERMDEQVRRFAHEQPIAAAATPPKSWYVDPAFLELERTKIFAQSWQYACPLDLVRKPGDYARVDLLGESYVVVRNARGELRGFHNVCRHHAAELLAGNGCVQSIVCPYHGWTYDLDGRLESAPRMGAMQGFKREGFSLPAVHVEAWGPLVFLNAGRPQHALRDELAQLSDRLETFGMDGLHYVTRRIYPMRCNWKVFVDNYLDGGYHIAHLHHGLASQLDLRGYETECFERFSIQTCPGGEQASFRGQDFRERIGRGALYAWIHPNFMLNRYGPILDVNWVRPLAVDHCEVVFDYWYPEGAGADERSFVDASLAASDCVQQEDVAISESVQRGLGSSSYDQGRYAPNVEMAMHHFHRLLAADLRAQ